MQERSKWAFWTFVLALLTLICIPSTMFVENLGKYRRFLTGFDPGTLRPTKVRFVPHQGGRKTPAVPESNLKFIEFQIDASSAKQALLIGDFNAWKEGTLSLSRQRNGRWQILLPLPPGRYHYLF